MAIKILFVCHGSIRTLLRAPCMMQGAFAYKNEAMVVFGNKNLEEMVLNS